MQQHGNQCENECPKGIEETLNEILLGMKKFERAFPDGVEAHRMSHEAMIKAAQAEEKFWTEMKLDLAKKGTWGLLIILMGLMLAGLSVKLGFGAPK